MGVKVMIPVAGGIQDVKGSVVPMIKNTVIGGITGHVNVNPLNKNNLLPDSRTDPMGLTGEPFNSILATNVADQDEPLVTLPKHAGIVNSRVKERGYTTGRGTEGMYPQPMPSRLRNIGLAHTHCDIGQIDAPVLRKANNFDPSIEPPFKRMF